MDLNLQVTATSGVYVRKMKTAYSDVFEQRKSNHAVAPWRFELQPLERLHQGIEFIMVLQQVFDLPKNIVLQKTFASQTQKEGTFRLSGVSMS